MQGLSCTDGEVETDIHSLEDAIKEMQKASKKAKRLGYPKLKKVEGEWQQEQP